MSYLELLFLSKRYWAAALNLRFGAVPQLPPPSRAAGPSELLGRQRAFARSARAVHLEDAKAGPTIP